MAAEESRQELLLRRSVLLETAIGGERKVAERADRVRQAIEEMYTNPDKFRNHTQMKLWTNATIDAIADLEEHAQQNAAYLERVSELDRLLEQLPPAA